MDSRSQETSPLDFENEDDYTLLEWIALGNEDFEASRAAWSVFYKRHVDYMYEILRVPAQSLGYSDAAADLTAATFVKVFESAARTFRAGESQNDDQRRCHVRAWLGAIANRILLEWLGDNQTVQEKHLAEEYWAHRAAQEPCGDTWETQLVRNAMEQQLNEREQYILRYSYQYYDPETKRVRLTHAALNILADRLATTPENIRQIRHRSLQKLKPAIASAIANR